MRLVKLNAMYPMYINAEAVDAIVQAPNDEGKTSVFVSGSDVQLNVYEDIETVRIKIEHKDKEFELSASYDCGVRAGKDEARAEIDELVNMLEMVYNNSFRQPDGMWKIIFSDQGRMNLKTLIAKHKGE